MLPWICEGICVLWFSSLHPLPEPVTPFPHLPHAPCPRDRIVPSHQRFAMLLTTNKSRDDFPDQWSSVIKMEIWKQRTNELFNVDLLWFFFQLQSYLPKSHQYQLLQNKMNFIKRWRSYVFGMNNRKYIPPVPILISFEEFLSYRAWKVSSFIIIKNWVTGNYG